MNKLSNYFLVILISVISVFFIALIYAQKETLEKQKTMIEDLATACPVIKINKKVIESYGQTEFRKENGTIVRQCLYDIQESEIKVDFPKNSNYLK